jgi:transposase
MAEIQNFQHERIDDVPLIIGMCNKLRWPAILSRHLGTHGSQKGLNNGQLVVGWQGYILSQADHRKSAVQEWANDNKHTLGQLLEQPIREVEFNDDRLGGVLRRLSDDEAWAALEHDLWGATVVVYKLESTDVRIDSTTSYGYHEPEEGGLMQYGGHSKDHRPDLPQLKLMAAAAEPSGHLIASNVVPGQRADDPLYVPLIERVRGILNQTGLLYAGDSKMATLATRAHLASHGDYYVVPLPMTGETAKKFDSWVAAVVDGEQAATLIWDGGRLIGGGYEFERSRTATVEGESVTWAERVQVVRSQAWAKRKIAQLEKRLSTASAELKALTPALGRGRRQIRDETTLQAAIDRVLEKRRVDGLLNVEWKREEKKVTRYKGPGRPGPNRATYTETTVRYVITRVERDEAAITARRHRLGWRVYATNAPVHRLTLAETVLHYRQGWCLERDFHLVKDLPLGLSPLFVWKDDQIKGMVRLLTLALRLLTLIEYQVRRGLAEEQATLTGLYEGQPSRSTDRPTGKRILKAFARAKITLLRVELDTGVEWHMTPLSPLHKRILGYLKLPLSLYADLAHP